MGLNMVGVHIGGMLGPILFGAAVDAWGGAFGSLAGVDYAAGWLATAAVTLVGVVMLAFWFREGRRGEASDG